MTFNNTKTSISPDDLRRSVEGIDQHDEQYMPGCEISIPKQVYLWGRVKSIWTQRLMNIHDIQSLPFIPSIHH